MGVGWVAIWVMVVRVTGAVGGMVWRQWEQCFILGSVVV
jgi:hypothetical protein